nr:hypothetical protein [uncultured Microbacterium sp.]
MLFSLTGASGAGKSTVLAHLAGTDWGASVRLVEFDSIGVPADADTAWRHGAIETWVQRALDAQDAGEHMLLCGQVPMGELLAAPSADRLDGVAVCLLDCTPEARTERLLRRGEDPGSIVHHNRFGEWFRAHTLDPQHAPEVIVVDSGPTMRWERWADARRGDPAWQAEIIDTDDATPEQTAARVEKWVRTHLE